MEKGNDFNAYFVKTKEKMNAKNAGNYSLNFSYKDLLNTKDENNHFRLDNIVSKNDFFVHTNGKLNKKIIVGSDFKIFLKEINESSFVEYAPQIYYELARQIGLNALKYEVATFDGKKILFSHSFIKENEIALNGVDIISKVLEKNRETTYGYKADLGQVSKLIYGSKYNSLEEIPSLIKSINKNIPNSQIKKIVKEMYYMHLLDLMCYMTDRHHENWTILFDQNNNARLAPIYDNEYIFNLQLDINKFYRACAQKRHVPDFPDMNYVFSLCTNKSYSPKNDLIKFNENHLKEEQLTHIKKVVSNTDIDKAFKNIEKQNKEQIPPFVKNYTKKMFNGNKQSVINCLNVALKTYEKKNVR